MVLALRLIMLALIQLVFVGALALFLMAWAASNALTHSTGPHQWLQTMTHPKNSIDCCEPDGDCKRVKVDPVLDGEHWIVVYGDRTYRWPVDDTTMGIDEHWWICLTKAHPDGPRLAMMRPRCLITPAIG